MHPDHLRATATIPAFVRTRSVVRAELALAGEVTSAHRLYEAGGLRLRFPRSTGGCEGILLNTAGGIAGGDQQALKFTLADGACATITSQAAEKVYRADSDPAEIDTALRLGNCAHLAWLPQETILFDRAKLRRSITADVSETATLTLKETVVFGRTARGERLTCGQFHDHWRIRRGGRLILAESVRLDGAVADQLAQPALGNGACAIATIVHVAAGAATLLDDVRGALARAGATDAGASAWNGMLAVRIAGASPEAVRLAAGRVLLALIPGLNPRIWSC